MRNIIFIIFLLPLQSLSQRGARFIDTVTVSGYFYQYAYTKPWRVPDWKGPSAGDHHFVSDDMLAGRNMAQYLETYYNRVLDKEKFLSRPPSETFNPFEGADSATLKWSRQVIAIAPFNKGAKGHTINVQNYGAWVTRATVQWVKLKVDAQTALHGFDRPITIDEFVIKQTGFINVYLPIRVLSMEKHVKWW